jgi:hypothetical protein
VAVLALNASLLILDDELGLLSAGLLTGSVHGVLFLPSFWTAQRPSGRGSTEMAGQRCGLP